MRSSSGWLRAALGIGLLLVGCGPKLVRQPIFASEDGSVDVQLQHTLRDGEPVAQGYAHPAIISDIRMAHILAHLSFRNQRGQERPVIRSVHVYPLAQGLAEAFRRAGPDDEVVARAYAADRRLQIFTQERVTAFRAFFRGDLLRIDFFAVEEQVEKDPKQYQQHRYEFPVELPQAPLPLLAGEAQELQGARGYAIHWRDPLFQRPVSLAVRGGEVRRRTVLMEAEPEALAPAPPPVGSVPEELRDAQLRALDQLDGARRAGLITEAEFQRRRRLVLEGRLEEAGYSSRP